MPEKNRKINLTPTLVLIKLKEGVLLGIATGHLVVGFLEYFVADFYYLEEGLQLGELACVF